MAYVYMRNGDMQQYRMLLNKLQSNFAMGHDDYPRTLINTTNQLSNYCHDNHSKKNAQETASIGESEDEASIVGGGDQKLCKLSVCDVGNCWVLLRIRVRDTLNSFYIKGLLNCS